jgi:hypothetical protein
MSIHKTLTVYEKTVDEQFPEKGKMLVLSQGRFEGKILYKDYPQAEYRKVYSVSKSITWVCLPEKLKESTLDKPPEINIKNNVVSLSEIRESRENLLTLYESRFDMDGNLLILKNDFEVRVDYDHSFKYLDYISLHENGIAFAVLVKQKTYPHYFIVVTVYKFNNNGHSSKDPFIIDKHICTENVTNFTIDALNRGKEILVRYNDISDTGILFKREFCYSSISI